MEHATNGKKHAKKAALRRCFHNIKLKIMLNVYELLFGTFDFNIILFVCVGNETFAHWRQLPGSIWAGVCDYDRSWSLAGRVALCYGSYAQFVGFFNVTLTKNRLFCAPIYLIIKLYNNNNNIFILYSAKSMYSSERFTIKRCDIASLKLIRNVKCAINILVKIMLHAINN